MDLSEMADEAGFGWIAVAADEYGRPKELARFAALVAEECARIAENT
jgi:hypothetical protein